MFSLEVSEKTRKKIVKKPKPNCKKNLIKPIKILKKLTSLIRFWFYKPETEKSKTKKKPIQIEKTEKSSQTGLNRFLF
jgi:hypothetical protein